MKKPAELILMSVSLAAARTLPSAAYAVDAPATAQELAARLPDFTRIVASEGAAVVNISSRQKLHRNDPRSDNSEPDNQGPDNPGPDDSAPDPNDPLYEFFRHFGIPMVPKDYEAQSLGSGLIISANGEILTNAHVVADADTVDVKLIDKRQFQAKVLGVDRRSDIALVKIDASGLPTVPIGVSTEARVGEWVLAIGAPFGFENSVTQGIVSAKGRTLPDENYVQFIQTDVSINPGNSGGPLFNLKGAVVGINSQIYSRNGGYMGLSFAIPIEVAMDVAKKLREHGSVERGQLAIEIQELTSQLAHSFGLSNANGALVATVQKGGPADHAGIVSGDVIVKYNGKEVESSSDLPSMVANTKPGSTASVTVWRKGSSKELSVAVGKLPDGKAGREHKEPGAAAATDALGLALTELSAQEKKANALDHGISVKEVSGAAAKAGVQPGDIVLAVNSEQVRSVAEFEQLLAQQSAERPLALLIKRGESTLYIPIRLRSK